MGISDKKKHYSDDPLQEILDKAYEAMAEEDANNDHEIIDRSPIDDLMDAGIWSINPDGFSAYQKAEHVSDVDGKEALTVDFGNYEYSVCGNWTEQDLKDNSFSLSDIVVNISGYRPVSGDEAEEEAIESGDTKAYMDLQTRDLHLNVDSDYDDVTQTNDFYTFKVTKENTKTLDAFMRAVTERLLDEGCISFKNIPKYRYLKERGRDFWGMDEYVWELKHKKNRFKEACKPYLKEFYKRESAVQDYQGAPLTAESLPQERFMQVMHDSMGKKNKDGKTLSYAYLATKALYEAKVPKDVIVACINNLAPSAVKDPARKEVYGVTYAEYLTSHFEKSKTYERMMQTAKGR